MSNKRIFTFRFFSFIFVSLSVLTICIWWAVGSSLPQFSSLATHQKVKFKVETPTKRLSVLTYNIGHGQGVKGHATDWRDEAHTRSQMHKITQVVKKTNADVVLLQEVDTFSKRTHYINQIEWLVNKLPHGFWACAPIWEKNYVPYPFFPFEKQIGRVNTANCIISRFPLENHERIIFDKPEANPFWYNLGYIDRGAQIATLDLGDAKVRVINVHLESEDAITRQKQASVLINFIKDEKMPMILGGDFNSIPALATKRTNFPDEPEQNHMNDKALKLIRDSLTSVVPAIGDHSLLAHETDTYTFPADKPNRKLDHIFAINDITVIKSRVVKEAKTASDHLPILVLLGVR